jgi:hypothetical protein
MMPFFKYLAFVDPQRQDILGTLKKEGLVRQNVRSLSELDDLEL